MLKHRYLSKLAKTAGVQVFVPSVKVKGLCSRDSQMETLRKLDLVLRMRPLDIQQGFQKNGAIVQNVRLRGLVAHAVAAGN